VKPFRAATLLALLLASAAGVGCSSSPAAPSPPLTIYDAGSNGVSIPTLVRDVKPSYTPEAIRNRIQGTVLLAVVVLPNGTVTDVTVLRSLDTRFGLDAEAVSAAKQWLFNPAMKDGVPVAVRVTIEMSFTLV